jgi:hypothetical protein
MKPDEIAFLKALQENQRNRKPSYWLPWGDDPLKPDQLILMPGNRKTPREIAQELGMHWKRATYLCLKWSYKDWYEYGVCADLGWLTPKGMEVKLPERVANKP